MYLKILPFIIFVAILVSCSNLERKTEIQQIGSFDQNQLIIKENNASKKVKGQVLYLPVYSNVPYTNKETKFDLSAFVAIHNTDFSQSIKITKVLYFHNDGHLVANYLKKDTLLKPLATTNFYVPVSDQSGTGANFIVEWVSDSLVNEPLIESVVTGFNNGQGISFLSTGKVIREMN